MANTFPLLSPRFKPISPCAAADFAVSLVELASKMGSARAALTRRTRLRMPDLRRVFPNGSIARKFSGARDVDDDFARPLLGTAVERSQPLIGMQIGLQVGEVHVVVTASQQLLAQRLESLRLKWSEKIRSSALRVSGSF